MSKKIWANVHASRLWMWANVLCFKLDLGAHAFTCWDLLIINFSTDVKEWRQSQWWSAGSAHTHFGLACAWLVLDPSHQIQWELVCLLVCVRRCGWNMCLYSYSIVRDSCFVANVEWWRHPAHMMTRSSGERFIPEESPVHMHAPPRLSP